MMGEADLPPPALHSMIKVKVGPGKGGGGGRAREGGGECGKSKDSLGRREVTGTEWPWAAQGCGSALPSLCNSILKPLQKQLRGLPSGWRPGPQRAGTAPEQLSWAQPPTPGRRARTSTGSRSLGAVISPRP